MESEEAFRKNIKNLDPKQYFTSYDEFHNFMLKIDKRLKQYPIPSRELQGISEVASELKTAIYGVPDNFAKENDFSNLSLSAHVSVWFKKQYGKRLIVDFSKMETICLVDGDLYKVNIPLVFGKPTFTFTGNTARIKDKINISSLIEDITDDKLLRITKKEIDFLFD